MLKDYSEKQLEILNITINYIAKNGIQAFSLRNIATEIGIKQPSLYGHFKNKEEILRGVFELYKTDITKYHESLTRLRASKLTKIRMYFKKMCEFIQYKPDYMNLVWLELYQYRALFREDFDILWQSMIKITEDAPNDPEIKETVDYIWLITLVQGTLNVFLKNKIISHDFDVLSNADIFWEKLEVLIKK